MLQTSTNQNIAKLLTPPSKWLYTTCFPVKTCILICFYPGD